MLRDLRFARQADVIRLVINEGLRVALLGVAIGFAGSLVLTRLMSRLLFGVTAFDPATFVAMAGLLTMVALAACYFPARRAARVDPMTALRSE